MEWLTQNWIWIAVAVGGLFWMTRMHRMGHGVGHSMGHGGGGGNGGLQADQGAGSGTAFDPVNRHSVTTGDATISTVYRGRAYYFENRENRDAFESNPEKYIAGSPVTGQAIGVEGASTDRPHRRHGC